MTHRNAPRHEAAAAVHVGAEGARRATTCRSCRTTGSTGTASRSRSCSPRRRSRPTTPQSLIRVDLRSRAGDDVVRRRPRRTAPTPGDFHGRAAAARDRRCRGGAGRGAASRSTAIYTTPRHNHNAIELHAATLAWDGDDLIVHDAIADGDRTRPGRWRRCSGSTRSRSTSPRPMSAAASAARRCGSTRSWRPRRPSSPGARCASCCRARACYRIVGGRTLTEQRVAHRRAEPTARFDALIHTGIVGDDAAQQHARAVHPCRRAAPMPPTASSSTSRRCDMDMLANTFMRAPGESVGTFALECAIDELAVELGIDPIELRIRNEPEKDPTIGHAVLVAPHRRGLSRGRRALRLGRAQRDAGHAARGRMAGRHGLRDGDLSLLPHARRRGAHHADARRPRDGRDRRRTRWAWAPRPRRRRSPPSGWACRWTQVTFDYGDSTLPGRRAGRRLAADRLDRRGRDRRAATRWSTELLKLAGNDSPLAGLKPDEVGGRDGGLCKLDEPARCESYASILARAGRDERHRRGRARRRRWRLQHWSMHSLRRDVLRGAGQRGHRRDRASAASSARSTAAASSTPRPPPASSAAASSWGWAWR